VQKKVVIQQRLMSESPVNLAAVPEMSLISFSRSYRYAH
jgi:hypothetical protein